MRTERTAILSKDDSSPKSERLEVCSGSEVTGGSEQSTRIHFHVMQSLKHNKWVLAAVKGTFEEYRVTDVMSANVELMVQYAKYLNEGVRSAIMEQRQIDMLDQLKLKYEYRTGNFPFE